MAKYKYTDSTPVDEPTSAEKKKPAPAPAPKKAKDYVYPDSTPVADSAGMKRGGKVKKMANGGSASSRADGIAQRGKTRGTILCGGGMAKRK